jgi:KAP family P-loop domain
VTNRAEQRTRHVSHAPLTNPADDALHRTDWAESLGNAIAQWDGRQPLCISLDGPWGSGKSTVFNFLRVTLQARRDRLIGTVVVNAWELGETDNLDRWLHRTLRHAVWSLIWQALLLNHPIALLKSLLCLGSAEFARFTLPRVGDSAILNLVGVTTVIATAGGALLASFALPQVEPDTLFPKWLTREGLRAVLVPTLTIAAIVATLPFVINALRQLLTSVFGWFATWLYEVAFSSLPGQLVVSIEDLDRVPGTRLFEIFRLLETKFKLRRVVYVLPMARKRVCSALERAGVNDADTFLERIVQVMLALPPISKEALRTVFRLRINEILSGSEKNPKKIDIADRLPDAFFSYFHDLRAANRYFNALAFTVAGLTHDGLIELDARDLVLIEAVRLFEPYAFRTLYAYRDELIGRYGVRQFRRKRLDIGTALLEGATNPTSLRRILRSLFEVSSFLFEETETVHIKYEPNGVHKLEHTETFDHFFRHSLPEGSLAVIEAVVQCTHKRPLNRAHFIGTLRNVLNLEADRRLSGDELEKVLSDFDMHEGKGIVECVVELELDPIISVQQRQRLAFLVVELLNRLPKGGVSEAKQIFGGLHRLSISHGIALHKRYGMLLLTAEPVSAQDNVLRADLARHWLNLYANDAWQNTLSTPAEHDKMKRLLEEIRQSLDFWLNP